MQHEMGLYAKPFDAVQSGGKWFEIRLHDEKRQRIAVGDTISFTRLPDGSGPLRVEVVGLRRYATFTQLYQDIPMRGIDCEGWTMAELLSSTYKMYTREQELRYGVLAIEVRLLP